MSKLLKALLTHYSPKEGLKEIDPEKRGTGVDVKRNISVHPISYYYQEGAVPESVVTDPARQKYTVKLPEGYPIYDIGTDPDRHIHNLIEQSKNRQVNAGIINNDDIHTHLKGQGFKGFTHSTHPEHTGIVGLYEKQPVEEMGKSESDHRVPNFTAPRQGQYGDQHDLLDINFLKQIQGNPTGHKDVDALKSSIQNEGLKELPIMSFDPQTKSLKLGEGNHRVEALRQLGYTHVPVISQRGGYGGKHFPELNFKGLDPNNPNGSYVPADLPARHWMPQSMKDKYLKQPVEEMGKSLKKNENKPYTARQVSDHIANMETESESEHEEGQNHSHEDFLGSPHTAHSYHLKKIPISSIAEEEAPNKTAVHRYADWHKAGSEFPPIVMSKLSNEIMDGRHRVAAARKLGHTHIPAYVPVKNPAKKMGKSELKKGLSPDQIKGEGYRFKILPPGKNVDAFRVRAYNKGKKIGHMIFNKNPFSVPDTESMADRSHKNGYHSVISSEIHPEHRGKGLYQHMINFGSQYVKSQGSKGLMSEGYQRSGDATRAWDKAASHAAPEGHSVGRPKVRNATYFKSESFGKSLTDSLFEALQKNEDHGVCTMFMFEGCDIPDVLHCTHHYMGKGLTDKDIEKIKDILIEYFKEKPFKTISKVFDKEEFFGENKDVRVLRPESKTGLLLDLRDQLNQLYPDKWPEYKPHVSVSQNVDKIDAPIVNYILCKGGEILWQAIDDLNKSELNKERPVLKFPNLNIKANPNQDIRSIATPRQKEIAARSQVNEMAPKNFHPVNREHAVNKLESQIQNTRGGFSTMKTPNEEKNQNQKGMGWVRQGAYTVKRGAGVPYKQLTPEGKMHQDKVTEAAKVHEAHHKAYHDLRQKLGTEPANALLGSYSNMLDPDVKNKITHHLYTKGYGNDSVDNEEILNHIRDIISMPDERKAFHFNTGTKDPQKQREIESHLKSVWNQIYKKAKRL